MGKMGGLGGWSEWKKEESRLSRSFAIFPWRGNCTKLEINCTNAICAWPYIYRILYKIHIDWLESNSNIFQIPQLFFLFFSCTSLPYFSPHTLTHLVPFSGESGGFPRLTDFTSMSRSSAWNFLFQNVQLMKIVPSSIVSFYFLYSFFCSLGIPRKSFNSIKVTWISWSY